MDSKKKNIIAIAAVAVIVIVIAVIVIATRSNKSDDTNKGSTADVVSVQETTVVEDATDSKDLPLQGEEQATTKKSSKKDEEKDDETNYWDNISIIEETQKSEPKTNKKGETVTEEYPGQDDGWSPIVSPDDLEKDK